MNDDNKRLSTGNLIDTENRITALEGKEAETHSGTFTKSELESMDDRLDVLEGNEPEPHNNEMRISELLYLDDRCTALEGDTPVVPSISFKSATKIDVSGAIAQDNPGIAENGDKYSVSKDGNTITITDEGLVPYIGGNIDEPKKWVGFLVDLGVKVQGTLYNIEDVDYSDATRWGAQNDTTFIMWLTTEKAGDYKFTNVENAEDSITITITFTETTNDEPGE